MRPTRPACSPSPDIDGGLNRRSLARARLLLPSSRPHPESAAVNPSGGLNECVESAGGHPVLSPCHDRPDPVQNGKGRLWAPLSAVAARAASSCQRQRQLPSSREHGRATLCSLPARCCWPISVTSVSSGRWQRARPPAAAVPAPAAALERCGWVHSCARSPGDGCIRRRSGQVSGRNAPAENIALSRKRGHFPVECAET